MLKMKDRIKKEIEDIQEYINEQKEYLSVAEDREEHRDIFNDIRLFLEKKSTEIQNKNFSIEVTSPGIGENLKISRQYKNNIGRDSEII